MKSMVREGNYFDGLVLYLSKWNWDNHESWHLYSWDDKDDEKLCWEFMKRSSTTHTTDIREILRSSRATGKTRNTTRYDIHFQRQ